MRKTDVHAVSNSDQNDNQIPVVKVVCDGQTLIFEAANDAAIWRAETLNTKEPDTVQWILGFEKDDVFFDVGANVGTYSVLAACTRRARVYAFEPEAQNFALLTRNIFFNRIQDHCVAFPLALSNTIKVDRLHLSEFGLGGSCHTFGENLDFHLNPREGGFSQGAVSWTLDALVAEGAVPAPNHIKIDVDGIEHLVLAGARSVLADPNLRSVLVELNTHLAAHRDLIERMKAMGFSICDEQVQTSVRSEGAFAGIGNHIFYREKAPRRLEVERLKRHVVARIEAARLHHTPFPHFYVENFFPDEFYVELLANKPSNKALKTIDESGRAKGFPQRSILHDVADIEEARSADFWSRFLAWFNSDELMVAVIKRFQDVLAQSGVTHLSVGAETLFMRDHAGYSIGPHTDSPSRLLSMMVYLPDDTSREGLGTSIYVPHEADFRDTGALHFDRVAFDEVWRAPYRPNSAFCFLKTDRSFHGVEALDVVEPRDTLAYMVKHRSVDSARAPSGA